LTQFVEKSEQVVGLRLGAVATPLDAPAAARPIAGMSFDPTAASQSADARLLMRGRPSAALGTSFGGAPYVSLVLTVCDGDASPLLMLSDLAQHTRNILDDDRVSLLFDATAGLADPLTGARLTVLGRAARCDDARALGRYMAHHPSAARYAGFTDFNLYRVTIERGHFVAGFGRIQWIDAEALRSEGSEALAEAEAEILAHMNADHAEAVALYARRLLGREGDGWRMSGIDPDGIDLRHGDDMARIDFSAPVRGVPAARAELVALARAARQ
jgi:putative heme iron utilization protein